MQREKLAPLTSLRFFAAAAIVAFHIGSAYGLFKLPSLVNGVSFFFVLSGFILAYNYQDLSGRLGSFYVSRLARLWPLHLFTFAVVALFLPASTDPAVIIANLLLLQAWIPTFDYILSFNSVSWSISAEVFFYATFPLLLATRHLGLWFAAVVIATLTAAAAIDHLATGNMDSATATNLVLAHPTMRLFEFVAGVATAKFFQSNRMAVSYQTGTILEIVAVCLIVLFSAARIRWQAQLIMSDHVILANWLVQCGGFLFFAFLIYVFAHNSGALARVLSSRVLILLGEISFATYMWHQVVMRLVHVNGIAQQFGVATAIALILLATYGGSYLIWKYLEVPSRQTIIGFYRLRTVPSI